MVARAIIIALSQSFKVTDGVFVLFFIISFPSGEKKHKKSSAAAEDEKSNICSMLPTPELPVSG